MGAYGRSALREFFLGSVTQTLLREAAVPLFLFH
jgi:nucleotide-binding universal stress UspA family protein